VIIEKVKVYGTTYTLDDDAETCSATVPTAGEFSIITELSLTDAGATEADCTTNAVVGANEEATIIIRYESDFNNKQTIKIGRPIPIVIGTGNGGVFTKQLQNGVRL